MVLNFFIIMISTIVASPLETPSDFLLNFEAHVHQIKMEGANLIVSLFFKTVHRFPEHCDRPVVAKELFMPAFDLLRLPTPTGFEKGRILNISIPVEDFFTTQSRIQILVNMNLVAKYFKDMEMPGVSKKNICSWEHQLSIYHRVILAESIEPKEKEAIEEDKAILEAMKAKASHAFAYTLWLHRKEDPNPYFYTKDSEVSSSAWRETTRRTIFIASGDFF